MLFEILCYAVAIVGTLAFFGNPTPATAIEAPQPQTITEPDHFNDVIKMIPVPAPAPAMAQTITAPVVSVTIRTEAPSTEAPADLATLKTPELRRLCSQRGIVWRNALGANRHLPKAEMIEMLQALAA